MATSYFNVLKYEKGFSRTVYLFGGWRFGYLVYAPLIHFFHDLGYNCVLYVPATRLIAIGTLYSEIVTAMKWVVADMQARHPTENDIAFGISFGTIFAMASVKACINMQKCVLISPFGDFAEHVRLWPRHRYFSKVLTSQPTSQADSGAVLNKAGLQKDMDKLSGKRLLVCYSLHDTIIHTSATKRLAEALQNAGVQVRIHVANGWHLPGIIRNLRYITSRQRGFFS